MTNYKDGLNEDINKKIAEVVHLICNNPAIYFSEADIHVLMMRALMEIPSLNPFEKGEEKNGTFKKGWETKEKGGGLYPTSKSIGQNSDEGMSQTPYKTMLVHREYGHEDHSRAKSDIVIFDEEVEFIDDPLKLKAGGKYLTPRYIFEFGTENVSGGDGKKYTEHIQNDLQKLSECKEEGRGFLIHIDKMEREEATKTKDKYKKEFEEVWKTWETATSVKISDKIKMLVFFVEIGVSTRIIPSKVEMFNPYSKNDCYWVKVSLKHIEVIIKEFLSKEKPNLAEIYNRKDELLEKDKRDLNNKNGKTK